VSPAAEARLLKAPAPDTVRALFERASNTVRPQPPALPPQRARSDLAPAPDDLRHAGISLSLRPTRGSAPIAERPGQRVTIPTTRYA
jgi:hypothetical protein